MPTPSGLPTAEELLASEASLDEQASKQVQSGRLPSADSVLTKHTRSLNAALERDPGAKLNTGWAQDLLSNAPLVTAIKSSQLEDPDALERHLAESGDTSMWAKGLGLLRKALREVGTAKTLADAEFSYAAAHPIDYAKKLVTSPMSLPTGQFVATAVWRQTVGNIVGAADMIGLAVEKAGGSPLGVVIPPGLPNAFGAALGFEAPPENLPPEVVQSIRNDATAIAPRVVEFADKAAQYQADHPIHAFVGDVMAWAPVGGLEALGLKAAGITTGKVVGDIGLNMAINAGEAYVMAPGREPEKKAAAAFSAALGVGLPLAGAAAGKAFKARGLRIEAGLNAEAAARAEVVARSETMARVEGLARVENANIDAAAKAEADRLALPGNVSPFLAEWTPHAREVAIAEARRQGVPEGPLLFKASAVAESINSNLRKIAVNHPEVSGEDLNVLGQKWFDVTLAAEATGAKIEVSPRVMGGLVQVVDDAMAAAHPELAPKKGTVIKISGRAIVVEGPRATKFVDTGSTTGRVDTTLGTLNVAIDLAASKHPGALARSTIHEMGETWLSVLERSNPDKYRRLTAEVHDIYARFLSVEDPLREMSDVPRLNELFVGLLENWGSIKQQMPGIKAPFFDAMSRKFGGWSSVFHANVGEWRSKYWRTNGVGGELGAANWSRELVEVADDFAKGRWSKLFDEYNARVAKSEVTAFAGPGTDGLPIKTTMKYEGLSQPIPVAADVRSQLLNVLQTLDHGAEVDALDRHPRSREYAAKASEGFDSTPDTVGRYYFGNEPAQHRVISAIADGKYELAAQEAEGLTQAAPKPAGAWNGDFLQTGTTLGERVMMGSLDEAKATELNRRALSRGDDANWTGQKVRAARAGILGEPLEKMREPEKKIVLSIFDPDEELRQAELNAKQATAAAKTPEGKVLAQQAALGAQTLRYAAQATPGASVPSVILNKTVTGGHSWAISSTWLDNVRHGYRAIFKNAFEPVFRLSERVSDALNSAAASSDEFRFTTQRQVADRLKFLSKNERIQMGEYLAHVNTESLEKQGRQLGPNVVRLSPPELAEIQANKNIQKAVALWRDEIWPQMWQMRVSLDPSLAGKKLDIDGELFFPAVAWKEDIHGLDITRRAGFDREIGAPAPRGSGKPGGSIFNRLTVRRGTNASKLRAGTGDAYIVDPVDAFYWAGRTDWRNARMREALNAAVENGLAYRLKPGQDPRSLKLPETIKGQKVFWKAEDATRFGEAYVMTSDFQEAFNRVREQKVERKGALAKVLDVPTVMLLAQGGEVFAHGGRLAALSAIRTMEANPASFGALGKFSSPLLHTIGRALNVTRKPEARILEQIMGRVGAVPSRSAAGFTPGSAAPGRLRSAVIRATGKDLLHLPGPKALVHLSGKALFDPAEMDRISLWGFDMRLRLSVLSSMTDTWGLADKIPRKGPARIEALKKIASGEDTRFDSQVREELNVLGQYSVGTQTAITRGLRKYANPFIATQIGNRQGEVASLFGVTGHRIFTDNKEIPAWAKAWYIAQQQRAGIAGYLTSLYVIHKAVTGKPPWEAEPGHERDIPTPMKDASGNRIWIKSRWLNPAMDRALRETMLSGAFDQQAGTGVVDRIGETTPTNFANEGAGFFLGAPWIGSAFVATLGSAKYLTKTGGKYSLLDVTRPRYSAAAAFGENMKTAVLGSNRILQNSSEWLGDKIGVDLSIEHVGKKPTGTAATINRWLSPVFGDFMEVGSPEAVGAGALGRNQRAQREEIVNFWWTRYRDSGTKKDREEAMSKMLAEFPTKRERLEALKSFNSRRRSAPRSLIKRRLESEQIQREAEE